MGVKAVLTQNNLLIKIPFLDVYFSIINMYFGGSANNESRVVGSEILPSKLSFAPQIWTQVTLKIPGNF